MSDDHHPSVGEDRHGRADDDRRGGDESDGERAVPGDDGPAIPSWDDEYLDRVAHRLKFNFDLERDKRVRGERFDLYGRMLIESRKQFFHPALRYARQQSLEHLFVSRVDRVRVADLERTVEMAHELADEWIDADEEHHGTEFTFVFVAPDVAPDVREFVEGFRDRTLLKYGYHGHYEVNLAVVAPGAEAHVASENADVWRAFVTWETPDEAAPGLVGRLRRWLSG